MKKLFAAVLTLALLGAATLPALAAEPELPLLIAPAPVEEEADTTGLSIEVNGETIQARACVTVPLRAVAEALGFTVTWDDGSVTVTGSERYAQLTIGQDQYFAAPTQEGMLGASLFSLGCAPYLMNDTTYVPVGLFDALLGCQEGCVTVEGNTVKINSVPEIINTVQIPSPFADCASLDEAAQAAGFPLTAPESVNGSLLKNVQTMGTEMIQVFYGEGDNQVCIRKGPGSEDISGDYNVYEQTTTVTVNEMTVLMKGENDFVHLAIWSHNGYTYAILARSGMSADTMTALIHSVK